jgi:transposase
MGFREVSVVEVREVLRAWLEGMGLRKVASRAGVDRKTARRYVEAAQAAGLTRDAGSGVVTDELIGLVLEAVRPARPHGHGTAWETLLGHEEQIRAWVAGTEHDGVRHEPLSITKIEQLLARQGVRVPYRTLHRFAVERCGFRTGRGTTVRVADGEPGVECQLDFAQLGLLTDPDTGRRRRVHVLIFTAVLSRHMFVWLTYSQTQAAVIAGCEAAWTFFGGVFRVLVPDNLTPVVTNADALTPRFSPGWLDYAQHAGFGTDPTRIASPQDKPRVERAVQYVRGNFWAGESFADLPDAQARAESWCRERAGRRVHGTTARRPAEMFAELEAGCLLPVPATPYDVPVFSRVKVHRDYHVEVAKALYSIPEAFLGRHLDARADSELVKLYSTGAGGGRLVKTHPRQPPGGRSTDPADLPEHKAGYATRDLTRLIAACAGHGANIGIYAERLLDDPLPWTRMRSVYRLQGLVRRYGPGPVETACGRSLDLDVVSVSKIAAMLERATETQQPLLPAMPGLPTGTVGGHHPGGGRFARNPAEYARTTPAPTAPTRTTSTSVQLTLIPGGPSDGPARGEANPSIEGEPR